MKSGGIAHETSEGKWLIAGTDEEAGSCNLGWIYPWLTKFRRKEKSYVIVKYVVNPPHPPTQTATFCVSCWVAG